LALSNDLLSVSETMPVIVLSWEYEKRENKKNK
jgi:hypothetical protein